MTEVNLDALKKNVPKLYFFNALWMFMVIMPVIVLFFEEKGLTLTEIYWLQSIFGIAILTLEVPSGYLSDLVGRKGTLILASVVHGIGFTMFPLVDGFYGLVVAEIFLALSLSLFSGTDTSMLYDTMNVVHPKKAKIKLMGNLVFYRQFGESLGAILGGVVAIYGLYYNAVVNAIVAWFPLFVAITMIEPPREKMSTKKHVDNFKYIYKAMFKQSKLMNLILLNYVFYSVSTLIAVWAYQGHWKEQGVPIEHFGYLWAGFNMLLAVLSKYVHKFEKFIGSANTLIVYGMVPIVCFFALSQVEHVVVMIALCYAIQANRSINAVVVRDGFNKRVSGDMRATANSIAGMGVRLLFAISGPIFGWWVEKSSYTSGFFALGVVYGIIFLFALLPLIFQRKNFDPIT